MLSDSENCYLYPLYVKFILMHAKVKLLVPQCSCLENPRDGGAWWAAIYGVAQSQVRHD